MKEKKRQEHFPGGDWVRADDSVTVGDHLNKVFLYVISLPAIKTSKYCLTSLLTFLSSMKMLQQVWILLASNKTRELKPARNTMAMGYGAEHTVCSDTRVYTIPML